MIDQAVAKLVKEVHPQLVAVRWASDYYAVWNECDIGGTSDILTTLWRPIKLELNRPDWYYKFATRTDDTYQLLPEYENSAKMITILAALVTDITAIDSRLLCRFYSNANAYKNCNSLNLCVLLPFTPDPFARRMWRKQIFLHQDDCHNPLSPTASYILASFKDAYEHFRAEHEPEAMRSMALRQAHHENAPGGGAVTLHGS